MATYTPATLSSLLKSLNLSEEAPNHTEILKHANNVLKTNKSNPEALHTKVVALLHLDRFEDVIKTLEENPLEDAGFELAYALYKSGKWDKAEQVAREARTKVGAGPRGERVKRGLGHVEAQAAYRWENLGDAMRIYKELVEDGKALVPNEDYDLKVNRNATEAQLLWAGEAVSKRKITGEELAQFETAYNAACIHIARNEFPQALMLLKKARELCEQMDLSEEDLKEELAPVIAQQVYALLKLGKVEEAEKVSQELDSKNIPASLKYITSNNSLALKYHSIPNPHLALRLYDTTVADPLSKAQVRPFLFQTRILSRNKLGLDLQIGKYGEVSNQVEKNEFAVKQDPATFAYIMAAKYGGKGTKEILEEVKKAKSEEQIPKGTTGDIALTLYATQLQMELGNITGAIETVQSCVVDLSKHEEVERRYPPALVGLLVALYKREGRKKAPKQLDEAAQHWKDQPKPNESLLLSSALHSLSSQSAASLTSAGSLLSSINLSTTYLPPQILSAGLAAAYATTNPSVASPHVSSLPSVDSLLKGIDIDALEVAGVYTPSKKRTAEDSMESSKAKKAKAAQIWMKKKRVRKSRLPKDYVEGKEVDKERWLPLRERSYYKPPKSGKAKRRNVAQGGGTQGGKVEEENPAAEASVAKTTGGGGGGAPQPKKKKKKAGKW